MLFCLQCNYVCLSKLPDGIVQCIANYLLLMLSSLTICQNDDTFLHYTVYMQIAITSGGYEVRLYIEGNPQN